MDQERTMQFILENLAAVTASQELAEVRAARTERQVKAIQTLMTTGMRLIVRLEKGQQRLGTQVSELAAQQKRTDQKLDRWLNSLKNGSNGHAKN
jgi:hypothetical protein